MINNRQFIISKQKYMAENFSLGNVSNVGGTIAMGYSVMNQRKIFINKAAIPQFDEVANRYFINRIAVIRATEGIDNKSGDNKFGTRSVLQLVPVVPNVIYVT